MIPQDWDIEPLRCDVTLLSGQHVLAQHCNTSGDGVPYLTGPADFPSGKIQLTKFTNRPTTLCKAGDILVTVKGSGSGTLVEADDSYCISRQLMAIRVKEWNAKFLFYSLLYNASKIKTSSTGLIPGLSRFDILDQEIPLPPTLAEQEAIAEALGDADAFIESLEQLISKKRQIKQGAMHELLTGKRRLPGFSGEWEIKQFGSVLKFQVGFPFSSSFFNEAGQGIRLVKNRDLKCDDQVFHYSGKIGDEFLVQDGDLLVGMDGDFLPCLWTKGPALLNQRVGRIVELPGLNRVFAFYYLIEPLKEIENVTSSTTVKHLSHGDIEGIEKPLPCIEEQTAIASILSDMDSEIIALEEKLAKARQIKQGMMQELLTGRIRLL
ncbi:MAG: restriction endonuclease subunit S [Methanosarcina sp.]|nr:restriction endonuclease subunit S [Methanosarcina sp.]